VILQIDDPANEQIKDYLTVKNYDTNADDLRLGGMANTLQIVSAISGSIGGMFVFLSFAIFLMNFQLIISRAKVEIGILLDLGYRPSELAKTLNKQFMFILLGCAASVIVILAALVAAMHTLLNSYGFETGGSISWMIPAIAIALVLLLQAFIYLGIRAGIKR
jgi:hypothetical protein